MLDIKKLFKALRILNSSDQSKAIEVSISDSATTNTKTIVIAQQTADRTLLLPDATTTLVGIDNAQDITNKTVSLSNTSDNKLLLSQATTHKIIDSGISHSNVSGDISLTSVGSLSFNIPSTKDYTFIGKSLIIPIANFNPLTPPSGTQGGFLFNTFNNISYVHNGTTYIPLSSPVTSVNSKIGDVVLNTDDVAEGISNLYFTSARARSALVSDLVLKANQSLNNLTLTSINQSLLPASDGNKDIGSLLLKWANIFFNFIQGTSFYTLDSLNNITGVFENFTLTTPSGSSAQVRISSQTSNILLQSSNSADATVAPTGDVLIESGNKLAGTGGSGNISLKTGTSLAGTIGNIKLDAPVHINYNNTIEITRDYYIPNTVISSNVTDSVIPVISFENLDYRTAQFDYRIFAVDSGIYRTGRIMIAIDGFYLNAGGFADSYVESSISGITFNLNLTPSTIQIRQSNTLTGFIYLSGKFTMVKG